jgi:hypothetical protein
MWMQLSVLGRDDASLGTWFLIFRDNTVTQCHIPQEPISETTLFSLSIISYVILVQISTHPYENKHSGQHQTTAITERVQWLSEFMLSLLVRKCQFLWGGQRTITGCMHNLSILLGHITNSREEFWKCATNTLVMNMCDHNSTTNSEILCLNLSLAHLVFQAYTCGIDQFHCRVSQKQASSVTELSVHTPVLD